VKGYRPDSQGLIPGRGKKFFSTLLYNVQTSSGAQAASYPTGTTPAIQLTLSLSKCDSCYTLHHCRKKLNQLLKFSDQKE
jgi:hypothetical protein